MIKAFVFTILGALSVNAADCVQMQLQPVNTVYNFSSSPTVNPSVVVKANTMPGGCDFFITVSYGSGGTFSNRRIVNGANTWPLRISKDSAGSNIIKTLNNASSNNDVLTGSLPAGNNDAQVTVSYWAELLDVYTSRPSGYYSDSFQVTLYRGTLASNSLIGSFTQSFGVNSLKAVDISIVPTGGSFNASDTTETLNFGQMTAGSTRSADVILKYNAGYILKASSENNGRLKHSTLNSYISYTIKFAGATVNLANSSAAPVTINQGSGSSPAAGTIFNTVVTIGTIAANQGNGSYSDTITLTVQAP